MNSRTISKAHHQANHQSTTLSPYALLQGAAKLAVGVLAVTAPLANARPIQSSNQRSLAQAASATPSAANNSTMYTNGTTADALGINMTSIINQFNTKAAREACNPYLEAALTSANNVKKDYPKSVKLEGKRVDGTPIGRKNPHISMKSAKKGGGLSKVNTAFRAMENARTLVSVMRCDPIYQEAKAAADLIKSQGGFKDDKGDKGDKAYNEEIKQTFNELIIKSALARNITVDGQSIIAKYNPDDLRDYKNTEFFNVDKRRRGQQARVAVVTDGNCSTKVMHPMLFTTTSALDLCQALKKAGSKKNVEFLYSGVEQVGGV